MMEAGPWDAAAVLVKATTYAATLGAAGGVFFLAYSHSLLNSLNVRRIGRLIRLLAAGSMLFSIAKVALTANSMSGDARGMLDFGLDRMILAGGEGRALACRLLGLAFMVYGSPVFRSRALPAIIGAAAAATSFAWVGHVHALQGSWLPTLVIAVHLLAVSFWLGALVPLLMTQSADVAAVAATASRFGAIAVYVVGALLAAGACLLFLLLGNLRELWQTDYGRFALLKVLLVACLLGLAALNRWRLTPRIRAGDARAGRTLMTSIGLEIALAAAILIVTASMTTLTGPPGSIVPLRFTLQAAQRITIAHWTTEAYMRALQIIGAILIAGGLYILIKSPSYSSDKSLFKVGSVEAKVQEDHAIPPWVGGAALAAGVVLVVVGVRKR